MCMGLSTFSIYSELCRKLYSVRRCVIVVQAGHSMSSKLVPNESPYFLLVFRCNFIPQKGALYPNYAQSVIPRGTFSGRRGENLYLLLSTKKRTKIVATRYDFWAQNVPKMLLRPGFRPEPRWGRSQRSSGPLAGFRGRFAAGKGGGLNGKGREEEGGERGSEGKVEGRRGQEGEKWQGDEAVVLA